MYFGTSTQFDTNDRRRIALRPMLNDREHNKFIPMYHTLLQQNDCLDLSNNSKILRNTTFEFELFLKQQGYDNTPQNNQIIPSSTQPSPSIPVRFGILTSTAT
jgi:hypothetical protein